MTSSRTPSILAVVAAFVLVASAILVARAIVAQGAVRTLTGAVTWVDTAQAQFDRDVHGGWSYPMDRLPSPKQCVDAMLAVSLVPGQTVNVYDSTGSIIGRGSLGSAMTPVPTGSFAGDRDCSVSFVVDGLPRASGYTVEIGPHRATYASYDLDSAGWDIELPLAPG
ncbi:MAG TPA: hypothetical protein VFN41_02705 [Candidatus Limnocylindrales bacterium]|nr:hypothetical protein [Candidatus Limnocylindrales bacterium]